MMVVNQTFVVTISRQFGSGGAYLAQRLAGRLQAAYVDREILLQSCRQMALPEKELENRDEMVTPRWKSVLQTMAYAASRIYTPPSLDVPKDIPADKEFFTVQSAIIHRIAQECNAVIVGRGGCWVLHEHPRHLSVYIHADIDFRRKRVMEIYNVSEPEARKLISRIDHGRALYLRAFTGRDINDVHQYHLSIDTGIFGLVLAEDIILKAVQARFDNAVISQGNIPGDS
jgi:CMP/dCMP kinase